ncbi:hypothetical protein KC340_g54 [Hortaea werneckii]|nr:hypothetical protein KC340_g54 [Hortaea werneckii]
MDALRRGCSACCNKRVNVIREWTSVMYLSHSRTAHEGKQPTMQSTRSDPGRYMSPTSPRRFPGSSMKISPAFKLSKTDPCIFEVCCGYGHKLFDDRRGQFRKFVAKALLKCPSRRYLLRVAGIVKDRVVVLASVKEASVAFNWLQLPRHYHNLLPCILQILDHISTAEVEPIQTSSAKTSTISGSSKTRHGY